MKKQANPDHPIHRLIADRWSPVGFADRPVSNADLRSLFEAVRWAPSSYNEQPWRYIVATSDDPEAFRIAVACLAEGNQAWAKYAPVLAFAVYSERFVRNGKPNRAARHDLGLAAGNLCVEATSRGLYVHQMIGLDPENVRAAYRIPEGFTPLTALAIGYAAPSDEIPEELRERDQRPRERNPVSTFVFGSTWGTTSELLT
ncbi:MAG: nitroreductase family protein [Gammaproteobacteria bacterium]|nr:nitroreductase family protein [Gammaproteobacteria bacterium]